MVVLVRRSLGPQAPAPDKAAPSRRRPARDLAGLTRPSRSASPARRPPPGRTMNGIEPSRRAIGEPADAPMEPTRRWISDGETAPEAGKGLVEPQMPATPRRSVTWTRPPPPGSWTPSRRVWGRCPWTSPSTPRDSTSRRATPTCPWPGSCRMRCGWSMRPWLGPRRRCGWAPSGCPRPWSSSGPRSRRTSWAPGRTPGAVFAAYAAEHGQSTRA